MVQQPCLLKVRNMLPKDTFPTIKLKGSECTILTVLGTHLNKNFKKK
nr:MAG TPA: hypothetical protein [Caudoviricetes sp.]